jgi:hypothetical protein
MRGEAVFFDIAVRALPVAPRKITVDEAIPARFIVLNAGRREGADVRSLV